MQGLFDEMGDIDGNRTFFCHEKPPWDAMDRCFYGMSGGKRKVHCWAVRLQERSSKQWCPWSVLGTALEDASIGLS